MNRHNALFGQYVPGDSPVHRWPTWVKYLVMFAGGLAPFVVRNLWFSVAVLGLLCGLLLLAKVPARAAFGLSAGFLVMVALIAAYHVIVNNWLVAAGYTANFVCAIYASRLVTMTTTAADMMDAIGTGLRPLRFVGLNPDRISLALALMWRSIPYLLGSVGDVRDAARARGIERAGWRFIVPVLIGAVGYALVTGDAVRARGLDDRASD